MWETAAEWHAALNDLPPALLLASVVFDLLGGATKREGLKVAGFWTLVAGTVGAAGAVVSGLLAEKTIEHGEAVHLVMERHEFLALSVGGLFVVLAAWRIWRRGTLGPAERPPYLVAATVGALGIIWVAHLGGTIVFRHGGGIPSTVMQEALRERSGGHEHEPGEEHDSTAAGTAMGDSAKADSAAGHTHAPGTPPHKHE
jgi:uncharacterized membrane protein